MGFMLVTIGLLWVMCYLEHSNERSDEEKCIGSDIRDLNIKDILHAIVSN